MAIPVGGGGRVADLAPDLSAVGNAATTSKKKTETPQDLTSFTVKKGDNGGVIVSEVYEKKAPAGRRPASFMLGGSDVKENPFSAKDGAAASSHITDLLAQMGVEGAAPPPPAALAGGLPPLPRPAAPPRPTRPPLGPPMSGPMGGGDLG